MESRNAESVVVFAGGIEGGDIDDVEGVVVCGAREGVVDDVEKVVVGGAKGGVVADLHGGVAGGVVVIGDAGDGAVTRAVVVDDFVTGPCSQSGSSCCVSSNLSRAISQNRDPVD